MLRLILEDKDIHPLIKETISVSHREVVEEVVLAMEGQSVVLVGMAVNPYVKKARKLLEENAIDFEYLEYGSYLRQWRKRNALKMWSGWPTFPMIFINKQLVGGFGELQELLNTSELQKLIA